MFLTSLVLASLAGTVTAAPPAPATITWHSDYAQVLKLAAEQQKPVAVFISQGENGSSQLIAEGTMSTETAERLKERFICLYVDTATETGKQLAKAFEMTQGLVLSDRGGVRQLFRHEGRIATALLNSQLNQLTMPVGVRQSTSFYSPASGQPAASTTSAPTYISPSTMFGPYRIIRSSGGCNGPNCR